MHNISKRMSIIPTHTNAMQVRPNSRYYQTISRLHAKIIRSASPTNAVNEQLHMIVVFTRVNDRVRLIAATINS